MGALIRTVIIESWLRNIQACSVLPYTKSKVPSSNVGEPDKTSLISAETI